MSGGFRVQGLGFVQKVLGYSAWKRQAQPMYFESKPPSKNQTLRSKAEPLHLKDTKLIHGWDSIKIVNVYSLLGLRALKHVKCYPTMTKETPNPVLWLVRSTGVNTSAFRFAV